MTNPTPWKKFKAENDIHVLGHFRNVHGERFVIYRMQNGDVLYFTGDEVDWDTRVRLIGSKFTFSEDEREKVAKIVWPTMGEMFKAAEAQTQGETLDDIWRPWEGTPEPEIEGS